MPPISLYPNPIPVPIAMPDSNKIQIQIPIHQLLLLYPPIVYPDHSHTDIPIIIPYKFLIICINQP
jgi:hypothetical protein